MTSSYYAAILVACFTIMVLFFKKQRSHLPPGPRNLPLIGSLHLLGKLPHVSLRDMSRKYGEIMYIRLGSVPFVVFSSATMAKEVFGVHSVEFASKRKIVAGKILGNDFSGFNYSAYTPKYNQIKKLIKTHILSPAKLRMFEDVRRCEHVQMVTSILEDSQKPVVIREKFYILNLNIITVMLFGEKYFGSTMADTKKGKYFVGAVNDALRLSGYFNISDYIPAIAWLDVQGLDRQFQGIITGINSHLQEIIDERRKSMNDHDDGNPKCFLDLLLSLQGNEKLSDITIISIIFEVLMGAVDSSAVGSEWAIAELLLHPSILESTRLEIEQVVGNERLVQESDLEKLPYIDAIAKETLRLHPLAPMTMTREVTSSCTIKGYKIPAGVGVIFNLSAVLLDESRWDKPHEFHPERFFESNIDIFGMSYDLLPFGVGRRMCPGAKLGYDTLRLAVALLVQGFNWEAPAHIDMAENYGLICRKAVPLAVVPSPRLPSHIYRSS